MTSETENEKRETGAGTVPSSNNGANRSAGGTWQAPAHYRLEVWKEAMMLVERVYATTKDMPQAERFNLIEQMQRSAVSVPSNIAEGASRGSRADFARFLLIARGSLMELDTQIMIAARLTMLDTADALQQQTHRLLAKLNNLIRAQRKQRL